MKLPCARCGKPEDDSEQGYHCTLWPEVVRSNGQMGLCMSLCPACVTEAKAIVTTLPKDSEEFFVECGCGG